jgi:hypothetical protein
MSNHAPIDSLFIPVPSMEEIIIKTQKIEIARLTEENDIQRFSIQQLSKQVVKMQAVVDAAKNLVNVIYGEAEEVDYAYGDLIEALKPWEVSE